jgi:PHS family inorganic phosphate transporter-like MFS transporter
MTDNLQLFAINLAVILLGIVYWQDPQHRGVMPHNADTSIKVATSAGAIFGQCIFGYLGDYLGRKKMYGVELMIIISTTLAQSLCGESTTLSIVGVLIFYRVVMGIGVGGDCKYKAERLYEQSPKAAQAAYDDFVQTLASSFMRV